jgi:hypothetical protein
MNITFQKAFFLLALAALVVVLLALTFGTWKDPLPSSLRDSMSGDRLVTAGVRGDKLPVTVPVPLTEEVPPIEPVPVPPKIEPLAQALPPDQAEEERIDWQKRETQIESTTAPRAAAKREQRDVCAKSGGRREEFHKHGRLHWRCRYDR